MQGSQTKDNAAMPVDGMYPLKDTSVWISGNGGSLRFSIEDEATWVAGIRCIYTVMQTHCVCRVIVCARVHVRVYIYIDACT